MPLKQILHFLVNNHKLYLVKFVYHLNILFYSCVLFDACTTVTFEIQAMLYISMNLLENIYKDNKKNM